jgi:hypothetical protein
MKWSKRSHRACQNVLSFKTHLRAAVDNTRSWEASEMVGGSRSLGQRSRSPAHALTWWNARRATWPIPDQGGEEVVISYFPACTAMSNVSPSRDRLLKWLPRSARRADDASALGRTCPCTRSDLRVALKIGWKKPIVPVLTDRIYQYSNVRTNPMEKIEACSVITNLIQSTIVKVFTVQPEHPTCG